MRTINKNPNTQFIPVGNVYEKEADGYTTTIINRVINRREELDVPHFTCAMIVVMHEDLEFPDFNHLSPDFSIVSDHMHRVTFNLDVTPQEWFKFLDTVTETLQTQRVIGASND